MALQIDACKTLRIGGFVVVKAIRNEHRRNIRGADHIISNHFRFSAAPGAQTYRVAGELTGHETTDFYRDCRANFTARARSGHRSNGRDVAREGHLEHRISLQKPHVRLSKNAPSRSRRATSLARSLLWRKLSPPIPEFVRALNNLGTRYVLTRRFGDGNFDLPQSSLDPCGCAYGPTNRAQVPNLCAAYLLEFSLLMQ
jgi:hypothetical protein